MKVFKQSRLTDL